MWIEDEEWGVRRMGRRRRSTYRPEREHRGTEVQGHSGTEAKGHRGKRGSGPKAPTEGTEHRREGSGPKAPRGQRVGGDDSTHSQV